MEKKTVKPKKPLKCQDCGTTEGVERTLCPYADEIHNQQIKIKVCKRCYRERYMDT